MYIYFLCYLLSKHIDCIFDDCFEEKILFISINKIKIKFYLFFNMKEKHFPSKSFINLLQMSLKI